MSSGTRPGTGALHPTVEVAAAGAVARGTLADVPIAHALVYLRAKKLSGILELRALDGRHAWLALSRGAVSTVQTTPTIARFGTVVYELGLIDAATLDETTVASAREQRAQVDILLDRGVITEANRERVFIEQARRRIHHLFQFPPATVFTFREARPTQTEPSMLVDVLAPLWRGLVDFPPRRRVEEILGAVEGRRLEVVSEAIQREVDLTAEEADLLERIASMPMTLEQIRACTKIDPRRVDLLLYFALIARSVEPIGEGPRPAASGQMWAVSREPTAEPVVVVHASMSRIVAQMPVHEMSLEAIEARAAAVEWESPYAVLGLAEGASIEAVRAAFFRLGRAWNPKNLPPHLEAAYDAAERVYGRMAEAHRALSDAHLQEQTSARVTKA